MPEKKHTIIGLKRLIDKYRKEFRRPENLHYYAWRDYLSAEKRYVVYRLKKG